MVLTVIYPTSEDVVREPLVVDVVTVHGLNGDPVTAWTHPESKAFWIRDFLPQDVPGCRVLSFGYNADTVFGNSTASIRDHARDLLGSLLDKREEPDELQRPIVFVAHSLGGIIVKQALLQARLEDQYKLINDHTIGIIFLGTPHRGSDPAGYGAVLTNVATAVLRKPTSKLISTLKTNSDQLCQLTEDFRFQLPKYKIVSFYELKPMKHFTSLIVEKHSALLNVNDEDQVPVDADHSDICKFDSQDNGVYEKLYKRIRRMLPAKDVTQADADQVPVFNAHYYIPRHVSAVFTGRGDICRELEQKCLPRKGHENSKGPKRYVLYGLGGSGKTQVCLKFAEDHREHFWGVFWIDASSSEAAEQGFKEIGTRAFKADGDFTAVKALLSNSREPWLLIIDNADDPELGVSMYLPTGNRGTILLTTRNPDCKIHATVGSYEFGSMAVGEAVILLLKATSTDNLSDEKLQATAKQLVELLGCLALAVVQAGAVIRQKLYTMEEYCSIYTQRRQQLLSRAPVQAGADYRYTVYTTWEVSVAMIRKMTEETANDALELLHVFSFLHFDDISEDIFEQAWVNLRNSEHSEWMASHQVRIINRESERWDPFKLREAIRLLSSFSLITPGIDLRVSMHPLVHAWARDRLPGEERGPFWAATASTLGVSISWGRQTSDYQFRKYLIPHIDSCQRVRNGAYMADIPEEDRLWIESSFALAYAESARFEMAARLNGKVLGARRRTLGEEHPDTLRSMGNLAVDYSRLGRVREAMELGEKVLDAGRRTLGEEHPDTMTSTGNLAISYRELGRVREAMELEEKIAGARRRELGEEHPDTLRSMGNLAISYGKLGRVQETMELEEKVVEVRRRELGEEHPDTLRSMGSLAISYNELGRVQEAVELQEEVVWKSKAILGERHSTTVRRLERLERYRHTLGQSQQQKPTSRLSSGAPVVPASDMAVEKVGSGAPPALAGDQTLRNRKHPWYKPKRKPKSSEQ